MKRINLQQHERWPKALNYVLFFLFLWFIRWFRYLSFSLLINRCFNFGQISSSFIQTYSTNSNSAFNLLSCRFVLANLLYFWNQTNLIPLIHQSNTNLINQAGCFGARKAWFKFGLMNAELVWFQFASNSFSN